LGQRSEGHRGTVAAAVWVAADRRRRQPGPGLYGFHLLPMFADAESRAGLRPPRAQASQYNGEMTPW